MLRRYLFIALSALALACGTNSAPADVTAADQAGHDDVTELGDVVGTDAKTDDAWTDQGPLLTDSTAQDTGTDLLAIDAFADAGPTDLATDDVPLDVGTDLPEDVGTVHMDVTTETTDIVEEIEPDLPPACPLGTPCDDDDPCTVDDQCDEDGACLGIAMDCDDDDPCTDGDACADGECLPGENICQCEVDEDCFDFEDHDLCNGTLVCDLENFPYQCVVDPATLPGCEANAPQQCAIWGCLPNTGECVLIANQEGQSCDDGDPCTLDDTCAGTACEGTLLPGICVAGQPYCDGAAVCLCDDCGTSCAEVLEVCDSPAFECQSGACVACQPACDGKGCGPDGCGGSCGDCPGTSTCDAPSGQCLCDCPDGSDPVCEPLSGTTYATLCKAECAGAEGTVPGICGSACYTDPGAVPAKVGDAVADFFCKDLNTNSSGLGQAVSNQTLKELIWIAYFGACT